MSDTFVQSTEATGAASLPAVDAPESTTLISFEGNVFNVTKFATRHPGGKAVLIENHRKDVTTVFRSVGHSKKAVAIMGKYLLCSEQEWEEEHGERFSGASMSDGISKKETEQTQEVPIFIQEQEQKKDGEGKRGNTGTILLNPDVEPVIRTLQAIVLEEKTPTTTQANETAATNIVRKCKYEGDEAVMAKMVIGPQFHRARRQQMLDAHPEIEALIGASIVPLLYMPICLGSFLALGVACEKADWAAYIGLNPWAVTLVLSWTVFPFLGFGLNNANHEICHGNTPLPSCVTENIHTSNSFGCFTSLEELLHYCGVLLTKASLLINGVVTLNHFMFYYYWTSHLSHHRALGIGVDRGHAFRSLYVQVYLSAPEKILQEQNWMVDGDLFGLHPEFLVNDTPDTMSTAFQDPMDNKNSKLQLAPRLCMCFPFVGSCIAPIRAIVRFVGLSLLFAFFRIMGDVWMLGNTIVLNLLGIPLSVRRPFDGDMFLSGLLLLACHFCWIYFVGVKAWTAVYISSFAQPTHIPASIYFGYFSGIHGGRGKNSSSSSSSSSSSGGGGGEENEVSAAASSSVNVNVIATEILPSLSPPALSQRGGRGGEGEASNTAHHNKGDAFHSSTTDSTFSTSSTGTNSGYCQITTSNYSPLMRFLTFDQSLHLEHHDFPNIPCHLLGRLRHIAPEYYYTANERAICCYQQQLRQYAGDEDGDGGSERGQELVAENYVDDDIEKQEKEKSAVEVVGIVKKHTWYLEPLFEFLLETKPMKYASCD